MKPFSKRVEQLSNSIFKLDSEVRKLNALLNPSDNTYRMEYDQLKSKVLELSIDISTFMEE